MRAATCARLGETESLEMTIRPGATIWLPCEVKPGPFSDERLVRVEMPSGGPWVGFVEVGALKEPIHEGKTSVRAIIVEVSKDSFVARIVGHDLTPRSFEGSLSKVAVG
jgi:hypothetical protein